MGAYVPEKYRVLREFANSEKAMAEAASAHMNLTLCIGFQTKLISRTNQDIHKVERYTLFPDAELFIVIDHAENGIISDDVQNAVNNFIAGWEAAKATEK